MPAKKLTSDNRCERILSAARASLGLTQTALGKRLKVSQSTISNWEKHIGAVPLDNLVMFCGALKVDVAEIIAIKMGVSK
ncbi:MAG: helix-turn-helix transcriptional regulator [Ruminococcus sp.]|nr:helix-turn-helix transcriptional regulator [Ruminococcus sp.]